MKLIGAWCAGVLRRDDRLRQRPVPDRVVPLFVRAADHQTQGQVVLPALPRRPAHRHETQSAVPQGTGTLQQGKGGEGLKGPPSCHRRRRQPTSPAFTTVFNWNTNKNDFLTRSRRNGNRP